MFCCAYRKERFFCFTSREPEDETRWVDETRRLLSCLQFANLNVACHGACTSDVCSLTTGRDVFNERPLKDHQKMVAAPQAAQTAGGKRCEAVRVG